MRKIKTQISKIQLFGERCSGTNYASQLLSNNFPDIKLTSEYGFKHHFHNKYLNNTENCLFLIIYRDIFDWLRSFHLNPHHVAPELLKIPFSAFIRKEWHTVYGEGGGISPDDPLWGTERPFDLDPITGDRFENVIKLRMARIQNWESINSKADNFIHIKYEDLRDTPEMILNNISAHFGLVRALEYAIVKSYKGTIHEGNYKKRNYQTISPEDINHITTQLEPSVEASIGYNIASRKQDIYIEWLENRFGENDSTV